MVMLKIQILVNLLSPIQGFTDDQSILYLKVKMINSEKLAIGAVGRFHLRLAFLIQSF